MITIALFDIDGILTDGMVYVDSQGNEMKRISFNDINALFELKRSGIKIGFITGEENGFTEYVKKRFEPEYFSSGCKDKLSYFKDLCIEEVIDSRKVCYTGDSKIDIPLLKYVEYSFVPANVDEEIKKAAKFRTISKKGDGVIEEVAKFILNNRRK